MTDWIEANTKGQPLSTEALEMAKLLAPYFNRDQLSAAIFGQNVDPRVRTTDLIIIYQAAATNVTYSAIDAAINAYGDALKARGPAFHDARAARDAAARVYDSDSDADYADYADDADSYVTTYTNALSYARTRVKFLLTK
jgi:hypothetical protein